MLVTWLGAARPLTWPHPGAFCVPNIQLVLTLDAWGSASLCQGASRRTGCWVPCAAGCPGAARCPGGSGPGPVLQPLPLAWAHSPVPT